MPNYIVSPNMNLPVPIVGTETGPQWATDINNCFGLIDSHNHSVGSGTQVTPSGLNINTDLSFLSNNAIALRSGRFTSQSAVLAGVSDIACVYSVSGELYYNDLVGNKVQITSSGSVAGTPGSISGLTSPASASYNAGNGTFIFQSGANISGNLDGSSITIREQVAAANGITLSSPTSLAANYTLTFPAALPVSTKILTVDSSGNIGDAYDVDNSTLQISSNTISVKPSGITATQIANNAVTTSAILANAVTRPKLVSVGQQISSSCGAVTLGYGPAFQPITNLNVTITTTGRPVMLMTQSSGTGGTYYTLNGSPQALTWAFFRDSTQLSSDDHFITYNPAPYNTTVFPPAFHFLDTPAAGTYTYSMRLAVQTNNGVGAVLNEIVLVAYEL